MNPTLIVEEWRPAPDCPGYEVSSLGRARSLDRVREFVGRKGGICRRRHVGRLLKLRPKPNGNGLIYWSISMDGRKYRQINRLVCMAFHGPAPSDKHQAAHLDGNTANNVPGNLIWATCTENASHKVLHGTAPVGEKNGMAKLKTGAVESIIEHYAAGETSDALGVQHGVSAACILSIVRGAVWAGVHSEYREGARAQAKRNMIEAPRR